MSNAAQETCENCGRMIGKLEPAHVWQGNVVCSDCITRLAALAPMTTNNLILVKNDYVTDAIPDQYACPQCGSTLTERCAVAYAKRTSLADATGLGLICAPPQPPDDQARGDGYLAACAALILFAALPLLGGIFSDSELGTRFVLFVISGFLFLLGFVTFRSGQKMKSTYKFAMYQFNVSHKRWRMQWICTRCGIVFVPQADNETRKTS